jgi:hypothetical protein
MRPAILIAMPGLKLGLRIATAFRRMPGAHDRADKGGWERHECHHASNSQE